MINFSKYLFFIIAFFAFEVNSFAQKEKGEENYNNLRFKEAVYFFEKALPDFPNDTSVLIKLARSYKNLSEFEKSAETYKKLIDLNVVSPLLLSEYAEMLKITGKREKAKNLLNKTLIVNEDYVIAYSLMDKCEINLKEDSIFNRKVALLPELNSEFSDFSPYMIDSTLYFVSDRKYNLIDDPKNNWNNHAYAAVFKSMLKNGKFSKPEIITSKINSNGHNGPIAVDRTTETIYFTRIENKKKKEVNKAKLYSFSKNGEVTPFQYNNDDYSVAHPAISPDGKYLFFVSDMPGGLGGKDIYVCEKNGTGWSEPVNLGASINTLRDEMFPFAKSGNLIYFSSNGHGGFGGLDIFSASKMNGKWQYITNLKMPLNSTYDDFGVCFTDENNGYFSSNRPTSEKGDNLYSFSLEAHFLSGTLFSKLNGQKLAGVKLYLLNKMGIIMDSIYTDDTGYFIFSNINPMDVSLVKIDAKDVVLKGRLIGNFARLPEMRVVLNTLSVQDTLGIDAQGYFDYGLLKSMKDSLWLKDAVDIEGKLYYMFKELTPIGNTLVMLLNSDGEIIAKIYSEKDGSFVFKKLPPSASYTIMLDEKDPNFNPNLRYVINGAILSHLKKLPMEETRLYLGNIADTRLMEDITTKYGRFNFEYLPADHFDFKLLNEVDKIKAEDVWKNLSYDEERDTLIIQNIYYDYNSADILPEAKLILNNLVEFMKKNSKSLISISAHTDSRGSAESNIILSQKRAENVVSYITKFGIANNRISGIGYGEEKPLNKCIDGVKCSESEHQINRRTEFNLSWSK